MHKMELEIGGECDREWQDVSEYGLTLLYSDVDKINNFLIKSMHPITLV